MSETPLRRDPDDLPALTESIADHATDVRNQYAAIIVSDDDGSRECTIFPVFASKDDLVTTWVSAEEESFVSLAAMR